MQNKTTNKKQLSISRRERILNSDITCVLFMPLILWYCIHTLVIFIKQNKIFRQAINADDTLTKKLAELDFMGYRNFFVTGLKAYIYFGSESKEQSPKVLEQSVRKNLVTMLDSMVLDSDLLGVITIYIKTSYKHKYFTAKLEPAILQRLLSNLLLLGYSLILYIIAYLIIF